jgi:predicted MPP superfamily phosphohydrolase
VGSVVFGMAKIGQRKVKLSQRLNAAAKSPTPFRDLAGSLSSVAREALAEANSIIVENVSVRLRRLPKKFDGFRIVQLSDIHHSPFTGMKHIKRAFDMANDLAPDMIALTGDYISHDDHYIPPVVEAMGKLRAKHGVYGVMGNHDHWTDGDLISDMMKSEGIRVLNNEGFRLEVDGAFIWLAGVDDLLAGLTDLPAALKGARKKEMKLLLAHNPSIIRMAEPAGIDLMLSGHTHGGQIRLRETKESILFPRRRRRLSSGLHREGDTQIYITRGIGTVVLPMRYGCPPEVSVIELKTENVE